MYLCVSFLLVGCFNPLKRFTSSKNKIQETEQKVVAKTNDKFEYSVGYVYGANRALQQDTNPSIYSNLARDLTERSLVITGLPKPKEVASFQQIVDGKLSTNIVENKKADELLKRKDSEIIGLQKNIDELNAKLDKQEKQFVKQSEENAKDAQLMVTLRRWFRIAMFSIAGLIGFRIASIFIPQLAPFGMILDAVGGGLFKLFSNALPKAKEAAGLVSKGAYDLSEKTLHQLVDAIETAKQQDPKVKETLGVILKDITDKDTTRPKILEVKKNLGYI